MEDLLDILRSAAKIKEELDAVHKAHFDELDQLFFGKAPSESAANLPEIAPKPLSNSTTPQQTKKRPKRLSSLVEVERKDESAAPNEVTQRISTRLSNSQLLEAAQNDPDEINTTGTLMPPPPPPMVAASSAADISVSSGRPQRAAKLKSEKKLKEPTLNSKMRRPDQEDAVKIKLECEQRASQAHALSNSTQSLSETVPALSLDKTRTVENIVKSSSLRVLVKKEKVSCDATASSTTLEATKSTISDETTVHSITTTVESNTTTTATGARRGRKKKEGHKPIKVERFSDLDKDTPVSSRTRHGNNTSRNSQELQAPPQRSIYEDAVEGALNDGNHVVANETVTVATGSASGEVTFNIPKGNATMVLGEMPNNATFQVESGDKDEDSMETARESSFPKPGQENSLMTEDDSIVETAKAMKPVASKEVTTSIKVHKMPTRTHELFNPLLQSPVKMRVEAFESVANNLRTKKIKEPGSSTTPVIGKLPAPALGRFLTPTQTTVPPLNSAVAKKAPMSACKASTLLKTSSGTNLKTTNSGSNKTLSRENSGDDFRKGLHQLAEERKKQREQKHQQAAQQREAKERERAERLAKLAKEREEKRIKKQQEKEKLEERKRLEMEELQRKLHEQEEAERLKKAKAKEQEREMLHQMKIQQLNLAKAAKQMMPPPPKTKYTFEMLHEDDSTDDEGKVSHKRPPVPTWSRSHVRGSAISMQSHCPTDVIDSFFSVAPTTPDLKLIFPNIDPSQLKRNSSVLWSTPPRYSELPKY